VNIEPNDTVVDIGANIGIFSLFAASKSKGRILAFEPFSENIRYFEQNLEENKIQNVTISNRAVSDKNGTSKLYLGSTPVGNFLDKAISEHDFETLKTVEVKTISLENIFEEYGLSEIDYLKLDCEGSEGKILKGTPEKYLRRIKKMAIEFHDNLSILSHTEICELLNPLGFKTELLWEQKSPYGYIYAKNMEIGR